jgi:predicted KAP-like P-loop ATPase
LISSSIISQVNKFSRKKLPHYNHLSPQKKKILSVIDDKKRADLEKLRQEIEVQKEQKQNSLSGGRIS